jgi:hypothetical protein
MAFTSVFYEFRVDKETINYLVKDLEITQSKPLPAVLDVAANILTAIDRPGTYAKVEIAGKPGLVLRVSKKLNAERLPHEIEGMHAFLHPSSEGYLEMQEFKLLFEACMRAHDIEYKRYD